MPVKLRVAERSRAEREGRVGHGRAGAGPEGASDEEAAARLLDAQDGERDSADEDDDEGDDDEGALGLRLLCCRVLRCPYIGLHVLAACHIVVSGVQDIGCSEALTACGGRQLCAAWCALECLTFHAHSVQTACEMLCTFRHGWLFAQDGIGCTAV